VDVQLDEPLNAPFMVEIDCQPARPAPGDDRALAFVLTEVRAEH
jgi:hypothetical protein